MLATKVLKTAGKFIGGRVKDNLKGSMGGAGVDAFRKYQAGKKDKAKAQASLNTPGNIQAPKLQSLSGMQERLPSVGMSGGGMQGGDAWSKLKQKPLFK